MSDITLTDEYRFAVEEIGLKPDELWAINRRALDVAFASDADLAALRTAFDAWVAARPKLRGGASQIG